MIGKSRVNWRPDLFLSRIQFSVSFEASMPSAIPANAAIWRVALPSRVFALIAAALSYDRSRVAKRGLSTFFAIALSIFCAPQRGDRYFSS
jgi:hypothetical protein